MSGWRLQRELRSFNLPLEEKLTSNQGGYLEHKIGVMGTRF